MLVARMDHEVGTSTPACSNTASPVLDWISASRNPNSAPSKPSAPGAVKAGSSLNPAVAVEVMFMSFMAPNGVFGSVNRVLGSDSKC
jgi:hypothetical protein